MDQPRARAVPPDDSHLPPSQRRDAWRPPPDECPSCAARAHDKVRAMAMASALTSLALAGPILGVLVSRHVDRQEQVMERFDEMADRQEENRQRIRRVEMMLDRSAQMLDDIGDRLHEERRR